MDYACPTDRTFVTTKQVKRKVILSEDTRMRRVFMSEHSVSVVWNPSTKEYDVLSIRKEHVQHI